MNKNAWFCPSCQKYHAPHVDTCPVNPRVINDLTPPPIPVVDWVPMRKDVCSKCGMRFDGAMGWVCTNTPCEYYMGTSVFLTED